MQICKAWRSVWIAITLGAGIPGVGGLIVPSAHAAPVVSLAPNSRLPYPKDADVWVDGTGILKRQVPGSPGGQPGFVNQVSFLVFSPKHGGVSIESLVALSAGPAQILASTAPVLKLSGPSPVAGSRPGSGSNIPEATRETYVFRTRGVGRFAVLGTLQQTQPARELGFIVLVDGRLDPIQAATQATELVDQHVGEALRRRQGPPLPSGATAARPAVHWEGAQLQRLLQSILTDPSVSPRAKEMARTVIPNATAINYSMWKMPQPLSDAAFFEFYIQQGQRLGWGAPLSQDQTVPGSPALLFKRPSDGGYMMIQARTPPVVAPPATKPTTFLIILDITARTPEPTSLQETDTGGQDPSTPRRSDLPAKRSPRK